MTQQADRQANIMAQQADRQADILGTAGRQTGRHTRHSRQTGRQTDRLLIESQTHSWSQEIHTNRQRNTDRQTDIHTSSETKALGRHTNSRNKGIANGETDRWTGRQTHINTQ